MQETFQFHKKVVFEIILTGKDNYIFIFVRFHLCTYTDNQGSNHCKGDSGGPLIMKNRNDGR